MVETNENTNQELNEVEVQSFEVGDFVTGQVTKVDEKQVIVQIPNSKMDGIVPISELSPLHIEKAEDVVSVGEELNLLVIKVEEDAIILSKRRADAEKAWEELAEKFKNNEYIEAEIGDVVKGGLVVNVGVRGFVPASLADDRYVEDLNEFKGKKLQFKIVELDKEKNRLILSHKDVKLEQKEQKKKEVLSQLHVGEVVKGTVQRLTDFGAFVDIGGVDGLVHISQLSFEHVSHPSEVVNVGEEVDVKILSVDAEKERISLSIKETLPGPWDNLSEKLAVDSVVEGTVKRLVSFGAFVEVLPGVEGLVHISQISKEHIGNPQEVVKEGQKVKVKILDIDEEAKRISLSMREAEEDKENLEFKKYQQEQAEATFQIADLIGDQLSKFNK